MQARFKNDAAKRMYNNRLAPETNGSAGYDLRIAEIKGGVIHTGVHVAIPKGWVGLILPRSGLGFKYGFGLMNTAGVIDSDYRGEIMVKPTTGKFNTMKILQGDDGEDYISIIDEMYLVQSASLNIGDRVCQMIMVQCHNKAAEIVTTLEETSRSGGMGSTGAN